MLLLRILLSVGNIFVALVLGAIALAFVGYNYPEVLSMMLDWARQTKEAITSTGLEEKYNIWLKLLLEERQLLFMFFTIMARIVLSLIGGLFAALFGWNS